MNRYVTFAGLLAVASLSLAACGDDAGGNTSTGGAGSGGGGDGGSGTNTSSTSNTSSGSMTTSANGSGGGSTSGEGGASVGAGGGSTSSGMSRGNDGDPCMEDSECLSGLCFTEYDFGYPAGSCSGTCEQDADPCPGGGVCSSGYCEAPCSTDPDCNDAYTCFEYDEMTSFCVPACTADADCPDVGHCDVDSGFCVPVSEPEVCDDHQDNDIDGYYDCEDAECIEGADCADALAGACAAASEATATIDGDTSGGSNLFGSLCGGSNALERIYVYNPPADGSLHIILSSATDQGMSIRTGCANPLTEINCADLERGGVDEVLDIPVTNGTPIVIIVDGFSEGEEGPFTLTLALR